MIVESSHVKLSSSQQIETDKKRNYTNVNNHDDNPAQLKFPKFGPCTRTVKDLPSLYRKMRQWLIAPLQKLGLTKKDGKKGVLRIAEAIFDLENRPKNYSKRFSKIVEGIDGKTYTYPFTFHLKNNLQDNILKCQIYIPSTIPGSFIDQGGCKRIKHSLTLMVSLDNINSIAYAPLEQVKIINTVIQRTLKGLSYDQIKDLEENLEMQNTIVNTFPNESLRLARNIDVRSYYAKDGQLRLEIEQEWYNSDLIHASMDGEIPADVNPDSGAYILPFFAKVDVLIEQAKFLIAFHNEGYVHGDIKGANILLKISPEGKLVGDLTDCDCLTKCGLVVEVDEIAIPYCYFDACHNNGYILPSTDIQGFVMTILETLSPYSQSLYYDALYHDIEFNEDSRDKLALTLMRSVANSFESYYTDKSEVFNSLEFLSAPQLQEVIDNELREWQNLSVWTVTQKYDIDQAIQEIKFIPHLISLLVQQKISNNCLWKNLQSNSKLQNLFENGSESEVNEAYKQLTDMTPEYLQLSSILKFLTDIRNQI